MIQFEELVKYHLKSGFKVEQRSMRCFNEVVILKRKRKGVHEQMGLMLLGNDMYETDVVRVKPEMKYEGRQSVRAQIIKVLFSSAADTMIKQ